MHRSRLVAALIDVPQEFFGQETEFWSGALGAEPRRDADDPDYAGLGEVTPGFQIYVQRVGAPARVHLDIETDDIAAEVTRLTKLGAKVVDRLERWVVMQAPSGQRFCVVRVQRPGFSDNANRWD